MRYKDKNGVLHENTLIKGTSAFESAQIGGYAKTEEQFYKDLGKMATTDDIEEVASDLQDKITQQSEEIADCLKVRSKQTVYKQGNIFDIDNLEVGSLGINGIVISSNTTFETIPYTRVKPNEVYSSWQIYGSLGMVNPCVYDNDYNFLEMVSEANGKNVITIPENAHYLRASFSTERVTEARKPMMVVGTEKKDYTPYSNIVEEVDVITEYIKKEDYDKIAKPRVYMPSTIYVALGRTIDIYNNQVCINADKFHINWTCDKGFSENRKFTITPNEIGTTNLVLDIYNDANEKVYTQNITIECVNPITSGTHKILAIGDSMTAGGGQWLAEVQTNLSNDAITYVGTKASDFRGTNYNVEGYNGQTVSNFLTLAQLRGETNPFYSPTTKKFDYGYYKTNSGITPNAIQILLGTNDVNSKNTDDIIEDFKSMLDNIRSNDTTIPIFICNAIFRSNQSGISHQLSTQGYSLSNGRYKYDEDKKIQDLMIGLSELVADYSYVYLVPLALCHDSEHNFGKQEIALNSRSKEKVTIPADSIHPNKTGEDGSEYGYDIVGYLQFADVMFSVYSAKLS